MKKENVKIIHHLTLDRLMKLNIKKAEMKPLQNEIKKVVTDSIPFSEYMSFIYDNPPWKWN